MFSGPDPTTIEIIPSGGSQQFNIQGQITDEAGNPISYTEIRLKLLRGGLDYSGYLNPQQAYPYITGPDGNFNLNFQVDETTPIGNYSLRLDFNGTFVFEQFLDPNNQYPFTFNLNYFSNASLFQNELKVIDPSQVEIFLSVEGNPTRTLYDNFNKPQRYKSGEEAHFQVIITQSGSNPLPGTRVRIIDVYQNTVLDEYLFQISSPNFIQFNISINNTNFNFGGIHKINVRLYDPSNQPYPRVNSTFIVINKTMTFDNPTITTNIIQRNDGGFSVSGNMRDNGIGIRGLWVRLLLFDENYVNASKYLIGGNVYALTDNNGYFRFDINTIRFDCIQGPYQLRIDFNGSIQIIEVPGIDYIPNYMINASSNYVNLNVTAGTYISQVNYYTQSGLALDKWINNDILYIIGNLNWDNSSGMVGFKVNVTVQLLDGTVIAYNDTTITDTSGQFNASLIIDTTWPTYRSETKIVVYFEPLDNNLQYVDKSSLEFV